MENNRIRNSKSDAEARRQAKLKALENTEEAIKQVLTNSTNVNFDEQARRLLTEHQTLTLQQGGVMQRNCNSLGGVDTDNSGKCIYCCKILDND